MIPFVYQAAGNQGARLLRAGYVEDEPAEGRGEVLLLLLNSAQRLSRGD